MKPGDLVQVGGNIIGVLESYDGHCEMKDGNPINGWMTWVPGKRTHDLRVVTQGKDQPVNCRSVPAIIPLLKATNTLTVKKEKRMKVRNKFYVAADKVTTNLEQQDRKADTFGPSRWTKPTLEAAIEHAEQILEKEPTREHVAIVRIVRVVRRKKAPLVIEVVK